MSGDGEREDSIRFLVKLARGLHMYGTPADRVEQALEIATARLGIPSQFFSLPTVILAAFGDPEHRSTGLVRVQPGSVHLEKLVLLDDVMRDLLHGRATPEQAAARVDAIETHPPRYGAVATMVAHAVVSACVSVSFGGGARALAASALLGGVAGALHLLQRVRAGFQRVYEPAAAFLVAFLALLAAREVGPLSSYVVTVSSLVVLLPGLTLTMAISELAAQSLVSGTVRLVSAMVVLFELVVGVALGRTLAEFLVGATSAAADTAARPFAEGWSYVAALCAPLAYTVLFRARPRDALPILAAGAIAFAGSRLGARLSVPDVDLDFGGFVGAFAVAAASNLFARWRDRPVAVTLLPGILLLVPGSVGFRGVMDLLERHVVGGVETAFRMMFVAAAIVAGLLFANMAAPPRRPF
jgi:uncharacterized membrane protein YjjP (DUF1212 family)